MSTELKNMKMKYSATQAGLVLLAKQMGFGEDTGRLVQCLADGSTLRDFINSLDLASQTSTKGAHYLGMDAVTGLAPDGGASGAAGTLRAMVRGLAAREFVYFNATPVGNVTTGEDDLMAPAMPAAKLAVNGESLYALAAGTFAATANNKRIRAKFGAATIFDTGALAITAASKWFLELEIFRTGAATQKAVARFRCSDTAVTVAMDLTAPAETLSGAITLKLTGEATATDDIVQELMKVTFKAGA